MTIHALAAVTPSALMHMEDFSQYDSDYLRQCRAAWLAIDPRDEIAAQIEAELRDRGEHVGVAIDAIAQLAVEGRQLEHAAA